MTEPDRNGHVAREKLDKDTQLPMKQDLTIEQLNAIDLLVGGRPGQGVTDEVGVTRQAVFHWRDHNPSSMAALNRRREELGEDKLTPLLKLKYHDSIHDAVKDLGQDIRDAFVGFQKYLYEPHFVT